MELLRPALMMLELLKPVTGTILDDVEDDIDMETEEETMVVGVTGVALLSVVISSVKPTYLSERERR